MAYFDPFRELDTLRREVDRAFTSALNGGTNAASRGAKTLTNAFLPGRNGRSYPLVNVREDDEHVHVEALAPGLDPEKLSITVLGDILTISGEKIAPHDVADDAWHRNERAAGRFTRSVKLPIAIDEDRVEASYQNGELRLTLPKSESAKPRKINVAVA